MHDIIFFQVTALKMEDKPNIKTNTLFRDTDIFYCLNHDLLDYFDFLISNYQVIL